MIIPLIVTGLVLGSMLKSEKRRISKKKLLGVSALSGLLNAAHAYAEYLLTPQQVTFRGFTVARAAGSEYGFVISSFLFGLLIVIVVIGIGLVYGRKRGEAEEEELEPTDEEESTLKPG